MEQNLLINAVKAAGGPEAVERAFVLANFKENQETFELFYQVNGQLLSWERWMRLLSIKSAINSFRKRQK